MKDEDNPGKIKNVPMTREESRIPLECAHCPKIPVDQPKHWSKAIEFDPWFDDVIEEYLQCRAVLDFKNPDPLMRKVYGIIDEVERMREEHVRRQETLELLQIALRR